MAAAPSAADSSAAPAAVSATAERRHVVVAGGGLAGLFAAVDLARAGHQVTLLEADVDAFGGKTRGFASGSHNVEHSMRVYMSCYTTLLSLLRELPSAHSPSVSAATSLVPVSMDYLPTATSQPHDSFELLRHYGIGVDFLRILWAVNATDAKTMDRLSVKEIFEQRGVSPGAQNFAWAVMGVWTGAKPQSRASAILGMSMMIVLLSMLQGTWKEEMLRHSIFAGAHNQLYAMYPTGASLVEPIVAHLRELGVQLRLGVRVTEVLRTKDGERAVALRLRDASTGEPLPDAEADAFVLAVDVASARRLVPSSFADISSPALDEAVASAAVNAAEEPRCGGGGMRGEWSVGCCFHFTGYHEIPFFLLPASRPHGKPRMVLDSPWHVTYTIVVAPRPGVGEAAAEAAAAGRRADDAADDECDGTRVTLLVTASNLEDAPGRLFGKPGLLCDPEEFRAEYLEQIGFGAESAKAAAKQGVMGLGIEYISQADLDAQPWRYGHYALGPVQSPEGHRWANAALLYIETPDAPHVYPKTSTSNLFLAGEFISSNCTRLKVPTMEKSAETGRLAAACVLDHFRDGGAGEPAGEATPAQACAADGVSAAT